MRVLSRVAVATMVAALALSAPVGAAATPDLTGGAPAIQASSGAPATTLSKATGLAAAGETITVEGAGFSGAGAGVYVGLAQSNRYSSTDASVFQDAKFIKSADMRGGAWSTTLKVSSAFAGSDCLANRCAVYTLAAHGSSDRSQDTQTPVSFAAAPTTIPPTTTPPTTTAPTTPPKPTTPKPTTAPTTPPKPTTPKPPPAAPPTTAPTTPPPTSSGPKVTLSKSRDLNAAGETITVKGAGFSGGGAGVYVGLAQSNRYSSTDASVFQDARFIKSADMRGGAWSTTLKVSSSFAGSDCLANRCAVYTLAAHGSSDRSQDTSTPVGFVGDPGPGAGGGGTGGGATSGGASGGDSDGTTAAGPGGSAAGGVSTVGHNSGLSVSLSKSTGLTPGGETVTISGSGFSGAAPGLYVGMVQDSKFSSTDASVWMTTAFLKPDAISGGKWSTTMELAAVQGGSDCMKNTCSIYTVAAHGSSDRSQDSRTGVGFAGGVAPDTAAGVPAGAAGAASAAGTVAAAVEGRIGEGNSVVVELSKSTDLDADGESIKITGSGFSGEGAGIYVGLIQDDKFSTTDAEAWMATGFIMANEMADGLWDTDLEVKAIVGDSDCTKNACSIYTIAAHGSSDRTQDSQTPVTFGAGSGPKAALAAGANMGAGSGEVRNLASSFSQASTWLVLLLGGVLGAGIAVGTVFVVRRRG